MKWPYLNCLKWSSGWGKVPPLYWIWVSYVLSIEKVCFRGKNSSDPRKNLLDTSIANNPFVYLLHSVRKSSKMSHLRFSILAFFTNYCLIKNYLSGNTVWTVASLFQKLVKLMEFGNLRAKRKVWMQPLLIMLMLFLPYSAQLFYLSWSQAKFGFSQDK